MKKHWIRSLLALLMTAALLSSMAAMAEDANDVEIINPDEYVVETEVELVQPDDAEPVSSAAKTTESTKRQNVLSVSQSSATMRVGETVVVTVTYTLDRGKVNWATNDVDVANCTWSDVWKGDDMDLYIHGNGVGTATITITNTVNSDKLKLKVKVKKNKVGTYSGKGKKDGTTKYRSLLIGEVLFDEPCTRNSGDLDLMERMLSSVTGPNGGSWAITRKLDLNVKGVLGAIYNTFKNADEDDVSLFFIATHGDVDTTGYTAGALSMIPWGNLYMGDLADALKAVPGKIIIIVESCGAGAGVYIDDDEQNAKTTKNALKKSAKAFDNAVINAFAQADPGVVDGDAHSSVEKGGARANTGELRKKNKFYVLAASRYHELSWGTETGMGGAYNYFTKWLTNGIGTSGSMPADSNHNGKVTLKELFSYISKVGDNYGFLNKGKFYYQHVQVYPKNSSYNLFKRK